MFEMGSTSKSELYSFENLPKCENPHLIAISETFVVTASAWQDNQKTPD